MSRRKTAMELLHSNRCMINSCLAKDELKQFQGDFAGYIIRQLSILRNQDKKAEESKDSVKIIKIRKMYSPNAYFICDRNKNFKCVRRRKGIPCGDCKGTRYEQFAKEFESQVERKSE